MTKSLEALKSDVWNEIGVALALLGEADVSPKARAIIREALESATGCKAPQYLGGSPIPIEEDACPGEHQEVLDAIVSHNSGEEQ